MTIGVAAPRGFSPVFNGDGSPWNQRANLYFIPSTDTSAFYIGDTVKSVANADVNGIPAVQKCATGDAPRGVIVGVNPLGNPINPQSLVGTSLTLETIPVPATKTRGYYVWVADDPNIIFEIQDDGITVANLIQANANKNSSYTVAAPSAGASIAPNSATVLLSSSIATTQALVLRLYGLSQRSGNDFTDAPNNKFLFWLVRFNQHELLGNTAGV